MDWGLGLRVGFRVEGIWFIGLRECGFGQSFGFRDCGLG